MYPFYAIDAAGQKLDGANKYTLHFAAGQLPPVNAFWSLTMYYLPQGLLVANPINRYLINSPMLPPLVKDADGGLTLYVQNETPDKGKEPNWLPAPKGPFVAFLRLYWPKQAALDMEASADDENTVIARVGFFGCPLRDKRYQTHLFSTPAPLCAGRRPAWPLLGACRGDSPRSRR
jgi:hypothetical protein